MRGFTMLLVVMSHVSGFELGMNRADENAFSFGKLFAEFRMPLFFFVSGFVLYKDSQRWNLRESFAFLRKKSVVQLLSPFLFLLTFVLVQDVELQSSLFDYQKAGYWFTFTLFAYYVFYILLQWVMNLFRCKGWARDAVLIFSGLLIYVATIYSMVERYRLDEGLAALLGVPTWHHFLFFAIGVCVRKYFAGFEGLLDRRYTVCFLLLTFALFALPLPFARVSSTLTHLMLAISGICLVFAYFREHREAFSRGSRLGRAAQYVGRHTLDIYLIHYFFIFSNIGVLAPDFSQLNSPFMELTCSAGLSLLVVAACLLVSSVLRLSPVMGHYLFGQKI